MTQKKPTPKEIFYLPMNVTIGMIDDKQATYEQSKPTIHEYNDPTKATQKIQGPEFNYSNILKELNESPSKQKALSLHAKKLMNLLNDLHTLNDLVDEDVVDLKNEKSQHTIIPELAKELKYFQNLNNNHPNYLKQAIDLGNMKVTNYYALLNNLNSTLAKYKTQ